MATSTKVQNLRDRQRQTLALSLSILISLGLLILLYLIRVGILEITPVDFSYGMAVSYGQDATGSGESTIPIESVNTNAEKTDAQNPLDEVSTNDNESETVPVSETRTKPEESNKNSDQPNPKPNTDPAPKKTTSKENSDKKQGQGDDNDPTKNKGDEKGVNEEGLYKGKGGSGGTSLSLAGWRWESEPNIAGITPNGVEGTIIFDIVVDDQGYFEDVRPRYPGTTIRDRSFVNKVRDLIIRAYLIPEGNGEVAPRSTGFVVIQIKSQ